MTPRCEQRRAAVAGGDGRRRLLVLCILRGAAADGCCACVAAAGSSLGLHAIHESDASHVHQLSTVAVVAVSPAATLPCSARSPLLMR